MIIRDENGKPVSAESVKDVTEELAQIDALLKSDIKSFSDEEKLALVARLSELKDIIALVTPELQKASNPLELMGFMKQVVKIKGTAEKFKDKNIDL